MSNLKIEEIDSFKQGKKRHLGGLLSKSHRLIREIAGEFLRSKGYVNFRVGHMVALIHIDFQGSNINTLAQLAGVTKQAMSKLVKELQDEGYVTTEKHSSDARIMVVKLSEKGVDCMLDWKECSEMIEAKIMEIIGKEKLEQLKDILFSLTNYYENHNELGSDTSYLKINLVEGKIKC
ncbi:MarR family winged helix-turn-helix transcriptional regulator [Arcicella sp. LKC2W]|uniref:MarR family winged helix-turn-helix transcriptional regulator n=1 Tax=Arcicella sp. LKC2W TaxID=2984198 RepID=UPI002B1EDBDA|nr:MarR family winged helix-turn-helix transcriptional regulator [Arcicella sp. LKC2W]MEA5459953.1 MarR family winged helix-turn-helix transcriptional regulator [Arcicella sp. LKC2W]